MKNTGMIREIDGLGRLTIPVEIRKSHKITNYMDLVEIHVEGGFIYLKKAASPIGLTRPIDNMGRITIPIEIRRSFGINKDDPIILSKIL